jgi:hypothetical protein
VLTEECGEELSSHPEWLERFDLEHQNFRDALEFLIRTADADWGMRLGAALFHFLGDPRTLCRGSGVPGEVAPTTGRGPA